MDTQKNIVKALAYTKKWVLFTCDTKSVIQTTMGALNFAVRNQ